MIIQFLSYKSEKCVVYYKNKKPYGYWRWIVYNLLEACILIKYSFWNRIDIYYEGSRDFVNLFLEIGFELEADVLVSAKKKSTERYLPAFEKVIN